MNITHLNPEPMYQNPAFSQGVVAENITKLVFVGGQNGIGKKGEMTGDDFASQTKQALQNVLEVLKAAGASQENVTRLIIYATEGQSPEEGFEITKKVWGAHPTAISVLFVARLARPDALVEIEAIAVL